MHDRAVVEQVGAVRPGLHDGRGQAGGGQRLRGRRSAVSAPVSSCSSSRLGSKRSTARARASSRSRTDPTQSSWVSSVTSGVGGQPADLRDQPLGVGQRHGGDVHHGRSVEPAGGQVTGLAAPPRPSGPAACGRASAAGRRPRRSPSCARSARRPSTTPLTSAPARASVSQRLGREVLALAGDEGHRHAAGQDRRRGVHGVAAQAAHQGLSVGQDHVVDREVPDDDDAAPAAVAVAGSVGLTRVGSPGRPGPGRRRAAC